MYLKRRFWSMLTPKLTAPYVGITGIMNPTESRSIADAVPTNSKRQAMIGALVSQKSLRGRPNQWPNRYPKTDQVADLFLPHSAVFNVVHYNTDDPTTLCQQLSEVIQLAGPNLHGFQLNLPWPPPDELGRFADQYPSLKLILQIGQESCRLVAEDPAGIAGRLRADYQGLVHYVLLDLSAGYGQALDTSWCLQQLRELRSANLELGLGVAGGLSPSSLHLVKPLIKEFPHLSIDAEARLRDERDALDMGLTLDYIQRAFTMFGD